MTFRWSVQNELAMGRAATGMTAQAIAGRRSSDALRSAALAFFWSRLAWGAAAFVGVAVAGVDAGNERNFDVRGLTHPLGGVLAPLARWDSTWYLGIAH